MMTTEPTAYDTALALLYRLGWEGLSLEQALTASLGDAATQRELLTLLATRDLVRTATGRLRYRTELPDAQLLLVALCRLDGPGRAIREIAATSQLPLTDLAALPTPWSARQVEEFYAAADPTVTTVYGPLSALGVHMAQSSGHCPITQPAYLRDVLSHLDAHHYPESHYLRSVQGDLTPPLPLAALPTDQLKEILLQALRQDFPAADLRLGVQSTSAVVGALEFGCQQGWVSFSELGEELLGALTRATRPTDRRRWAEVISAYAEADWLRAHVTALIAELSRGPAPVVAALAPTLLALPNTDHQIPVGRLVSQALLHATKTTTRALLTTLAALPQPADSAELTDTLTELAGGTAPESRQAAALLQQWGAAASTPPADTGAAVTITPWPAVPPAWTPPPVSYRDPHADEATCLEEVARHAAFFATPTTGRRWQIAYEQLLAALVQLLRHAPDARPGALRAIAGNAEPADFQRWAAAEPCPSGALARRTYDILNARRPLPVILSLPSFPDGRIDPVDLAGRLQCYAEDGVPVVASDLALALLRLDPSCEAGIPRAFDTAELPACASSQAEVLADPQLLDAAAHHVPEGLRELIRSVLLPLNVAVDPESAPTQHQDTVATFNAAHLVAAALVCPITGAQYPEWLTQLGCAKTSIELLGTMPLQGDVLTAHYLVAPYVTDSLVGSVLENFAHWSVPLPSQQAMALVGMQQLHGTDNAAISLEATITAWERGLLPVTAADAHRPAAEAQGKWAARLPVLHELEAAGAGLLAWTHAAQLINTAGAASRIPAQTVDVLRAMLEWAPTAAATVAAGVMPAELLAVPGVLTIASRSTKSQAGRLAQELAGVLGVTAPPPNAPAVAEPVREGAAATPPARPTKKLPTKQGWALPVEGRCVADTSRITVVEADHPHYSSTLVTIALQGVTGAPAEPLYAHTSWTYGLTHEHQLSVGDGLTPHTSTHTGFVFATAAGELQFAPWRSPDADQPFSGVRGPLFQTALVALLASVCTGHHDTAFGAKEALLTHLTWVNDGLIAADQMPFGVADLQAAVRAVYGQPGITPERLLRLIGELPVAWRWRLCATLVECAAQQGPGRGMAKVLDLLTSDRRAVTAAVRAGAGDSLRELPGLAELCTAKGVVGKKAKALAAEL